MLEYVIDFEMVVSVDEIELIWSKQPQVLPISEYAEFVS